MASVRIIKGSLRNVVDEVQFEKLYKPNGWRLDEVEEQPSEMSKVIDTLHTESELKNYLKMKNTKAKQFDDKLFYSEINNE